MRKFWRFFLMARILKNLTNPRMRIMVKTLAMWIDQALVARGNLFRSHHLYHINYLTKSVLIMNKLY